MTLFTPNDEISWPDARQLLYSKTADLLRGIQICLTDDLWVPALILLYSGIDAMAWLNRNSSLEDTSRSDFIEWADRYMERGGCLIVSSQELYAARCALVHSMTNTARSNRQNGVRRVSYHRHGGTIPGLTSPSPKPFRPTDVGTDIDVDELVDSFTDGVKRFIADVEERSRLRTVVHERISRFYLRRVSWG